MLLFLKLANFSLKINDPLFLDMQHIDLFVELSYHIFVFLSCIQDLSLDFTSALYPFLILGLLFVALLGETSVLLLKFRLLIEKILKGCNCL
jgi:hypothetical protein